MSYTGKSLKIWAISVWTRAESSAHIKQFGLCCNQYIHKYDKPNTSLCLAFTADVILVSHKPLKPRVPLYIRTSQCAYFFRTVLCEGAWLEWPVGIWIQVLHVGLHAGAVSWGLCLDCCSSGVTNLFCSVQCLFLNGNYINTVKCCVSGECVNFLVGSREHFSFGFVSGQ